MAPARITSWPEAKTSANTSGISPSDIEWALRRKCTWTTKRSAAAKATSRTQIETCIEPTIGLAVTAPELNRATPAATRTALSTQMVTSPRDIRVARAR